MSDADRPAARLPLPGLDPEVDRWPLPPEAVHYLIDVRRLGAGALIEVFGADGLTGLARLSVESEAWFAEACGPLEEGLTGAPLTVCYGLPRGDKLDRVIRGLTELGAGRIILVSTARSVVRVAEDKAARKRARWQKIVAEAARQSGRADAPEVVGPVSMGKALDLTADQIGLLAHPEALTPLSEAPALAHSAVALFIGPEGGFSPQEVSEARAAGVTPIALGARVLRTETAAVAATALVLDRMEAL